MISSGRRRKRETEKHTGSEVVLCLNVERHVGKLAERALRVVEGVGAERDEKISASSLTRWKRTHSFVGSSTNPRRRESATSSGDPRIQALLQKKRHSGGLSRSWRSYSSAKLVGA